VKLPPSAVRQIICENCILVANRFWLMLSMGRAFSFEAEANVPELWEIVSVQYQETHKREKEKSALLAGR
jgi:hypothetical protein